MTCTETPCLTVRHVSLISISATAVISHIFFELTFLPNWEAGLLLNLGPGGFATDSVQVVKG